MTSAPKKIIIVEDQPSVADLLEEMLSIEPRYINYCPYKITIAESGDEIIVGTRLLPEKSRNPKMDKMAKNINTTLRSMVEYAAVEDPFILEDNTGDGS